jgi:hypothetical protein
VCVIVGGKTEFGQSKQASSHGSARDAGAVTDLRNRQVPFFVRECEQHSKSTRQGSHKIRIITKLVDLFNRQCIGVGKDGWPPRYPAMTGWFNRTLCHCCVSGWFLLDQVTIQFLEQFGIVK